MFKRFFHSAPRPVSTHQRVLFVFALMFLSCAIQSQRGHTTFTAFIALTLAVFYVVCAFALYRFSQPKTTRQKTDSFKHEPALETASACAVRDTDAYVWLLKFVVVMQLGFFVWSYRPLWLVAVFLGFVILFDAPKFGFSRGEDVSPLFAHWLRWRPCFILAVYAPLCWMYVTSDNFFYKHIDVYYFQRDGARALLQGVNPYTLRPPSIYPPNTPFYAPELVKNGVLQFGYPYLPLTLFMALPGFLLGDVRFSLLAAMALSVYLLMNIGDFTHLHDRSQHARRSSTRSSQIAVLSASLLLLFPHFLHLLVNAWCDSFVVVLFCLVVLCAVRKSPWLPIAVGLWLVSKQYVVLLLPLTWLLLPAQSSWKEKRFFYFVMIGTALLISLPMILWNVREFTWSALELQFHQPLRDEALSLAVAYKLLTGVVPPFWISFLAAGVGSVWALGTAPRNVNGFCAACTLVFFVFIAFNKQAFINYYFVVFAMLCSTLGTLYLNDEGVSEA